MKQVGSKGEDLAAEFLKDNGYRIIARNYKTPIGELDIIAKDGEILVFIEVKTRSSNAYGYPFEAVGSRKKHKLKNLALLYLKNQKKNCAVRFDVISINLNGTKNEIEHIKDAFEV
ncbi:MAG: YraN family protein [Nitrospirae bacterium RIFOXYB2_FULL_43_5]|nr:MAG: YraN family protein [Nitrospirae bacterium GWD2_44_7]OGW32242.1 MAG: YraN family protein [Nitrospirae bacterium GWF2_44_13]OGW63249.1 MAG: YraN family protein [Nitrospirae bacterium RIFOXYA2_FULL_44_9]OGW74516.1 MAG: YraN family protein [Nitrospirae bacterium RIFOXYC2_FULL_44_7]OGW76534.1 MAG: YraN family protein [Nitrospirae bacterium RIFOXYB2_FULL_43_5]HBG92642.1 YraN family protein [Nitrospiraceae bacterium]